MTGESRFASELAARVEAVDGALAEWPLAGAPDHLYAASRHLLDAGGKRLRPAMLLLVTEACGCDPADHDDRLPAALAVEFVHTLSLVHDDVIDDDDLRRGVESVHERWERSTAILAGDLLHMKAFEAMLAADVHPERRSRCLDLLTRTCRELCEGQERDLELAGGSVPFEERYLEMVGKKTGALFEGSARIGGVLGGASDAVVDQLGAYGRKLGVAFQPYDDLLDLRGTSETIGKTRGSDVREGKETLLTIHARRKGVDVTAPSDAEAAVDRLGATGSIAYVRGRADEYVAESKAHLSALPDSRARTLLGGVADYVLEREF